MTPNDDTNISRLDELKQNTEPTVVTPTPPSTSTDPVQEFSNPEQGLNIDPDELTEKEIFEQEAIQKAVAREKELNQELGLEVPEGVSEEDAEEWNLLFARIRSMYSNEMIGKEDVYTFFEAFDRQNSEQRLETLDNLFKLEREKLEEVGYVEEAIAQTDLINEVLAFSLLFPEDLRKEFLYIFQKGETMDETAERQINQQIANNQDSVAYQRLQRVVGGGNLNNDKVLTVEDLVGKFDLDDTARSTQTYTTSPTRAPQVPNTQPRQAPTPPAPQPQGQPQNSAPTPQQQPVQPVPKPTTNPNQPDQAPASAISHETKGLGDLLK